VAVALLRDAREPRAMPALDPIEWRLDGFAPVSPSRCQRAGSRYESAAPEMAPRASGHGVYAHAQTSIVQGIGLKLK
jgi:hypothetical protein